ncbi:MAG: metallopeptidase [Lachnospiraceae bacterium]|nr:metallopeptidase [Lachnospiraceae bacterium]
MEEHRREQEGSAHKLALIRIGNRIWEAAGRELYLSMRFLDLAFGRLSFVMDLSTRTFGTDGVSCRYNPRYLMELYENSRIMVNRGYLHMLLHCILRHMYRESEEERQELYDLACDITVESIIDSMDYRAVAMTVKDEREELYEALKKERKVLTAEGVYTWLKKQNLSLSEVIRLEQEFRKDDHDFFYRRREQGSGETAADNQNAEGRSEEHQNMEHQNAGGSDRAGQNDSVAGARRNRENQKKDWEKVSRKLAVSLESFGREAGKGAGSLSAVLAVSNREECGYQEFLRRFSVLREENRLDPDSFDYGYYAYGLSLYKNMPLIEPLEQREVKKIEEFAIVIDTSGSCSGELVHRFLKETVTVLGQQESFFRKRRVHVIQCDAAVQSDTVIEEEEDIERFAETLTISGYGGTDFRPAFTYVNNLVERGEFVNLRGLLYFTDGYGVYPERRPMYDTAFVFVGEDYEEHLVPGWAARIVLPPEQWGESEQRGRMTV